MDKRYNYHFTPPKGWTNDPNGLVYIDGVYHLFYQHYPHDIVWGPMHWGHAVSWDLIHWEHQPIAICPTETEYIFSGSCMYDKENVSGLGTKEQPPLIAFYTAHNPVTGEEQQCVAYSTDFEHFTKYEGSPVIENRKFKSDEVVSVKKGVSSIENPDYKKDFRDPKVFPNPIKGGFTMVLAAGHRLEFYHSDNLLSWEKTGEFAPKNGFAEICECPDCFPLQTEEGTKWVLTLSLTSHVMPYYVGEFNGNTFIGDETANAAFCQPLLLDYGMDNYAMVSFMHSPEPLLLGWGESWDYVSQTPAETYRGKMTMARSVQLVKVDEVWRMRFEPAGKVEEQDCWHGIVKVGERAEFETVGGGKLVLSVTESEIMVDRSDAGNMVFSPWLQEHGLIHVAKRVHSGDCSITVIKDNGYFEVFAEDGLVVFSVMTFCKL